MIKSLPPYWSPKVCRPMMMGFVHPGTYLFTFLQIIDSLNWVPLRAFRIIPLGLGHICVKLNSAKKERRKELVTRRDKNYKQCNFVNKEKRRHKTSEKFVCTVFWICNFV
jgi:hypothetical protein